MAKLAPRLTTVFILGLNSACGVEAPETPAEPPAPEQAARLSMEGATCAVVGSDDDSKLWQHGYELMTCLRELAYEDWPRASAEATHIAGWSLDHVDLNEVTSSLTDYESSEALRADLEARGLLGGPGAEYFEADTEENWQPITVRDWLQKSGNWYDFDAETGTFPNNRDYLLESLAALFDESLSEAVFIEIAPEDWESDDPYQLRATLGERSWEREAANYGDWYDVQAVLDMLNEMVADIGVSKRAMPLQTFDQSVTVIVGPGEALVAAANDGLVDPAVARGSMDRGKAFEDQVRKQLGL